MALFYSVQEVLPVRSWTSAVEVSVGGKVNCGLGLPQFYLHGTAER